VDVLKKQYFEDGTLPAGVKSWKELFGHIYADMQVHASERGFVDSLVRGSAGHLIHWYRIEWRSEITWSPKNFGATHWSDNVLWFFGDGKDLPQGEKEIVRAAFLDDYGRFARGEVINWSMSDPLEVRRLKADGTVDVWRDQLWSDKLKIWRALQDAMSKQKFQAQKFSL
jgi:hypothetical protein